MGSVIHRMQCVGDGQIVAESYDMAAEDPRLGGYPPVEYTSIPLIVPKFKKVFHGS